VSAAPPTRDFAAPLGLTNQGGQTAHASMPAGHPPIPASASPLAPAAIAVPLCGVGGGAPARTLHPPLTLARRTTTNFTTTRSATHTPKETR
jgi:hypothetical protein